MRRGWCAGAVCVGCVKFNMALEIAIVVVALALAVMLVRLFKRLLWFAALVLLALAAFLFL